MWIFCCPARDRAGSGRPDRGSLWREQRERLAQRNGVSRPELGNPRRHGRSAYPQAVQGLLLPRVPRAPPHGRGAHRCGARSLGAGRLDPLGLRCGVGHGLSGISKSGARYAPRSTTKVKAFLAHPIEGDWPYCRSTPPT